MKKIIVLLLSSTIVSMICFAQKQETATVGEMFTLEVISDSLQVGDTLSLNSYAPDATSINYYIVNETGKIIIHSDTLLAAGMYNVSMNKNRSNNIDFFISEGEPQQFSVNYYRPEGGMRITEFTGSPENQAFADYKQFMQEQQMQRYYLEENLRGYPQDSDTARLITSQIDELFTQIKEKWAEIETNYQGKMLSLFLSFIREPEPPPFVPSASEVGNIDSLQNEYYLAFYKEHFFDNHNLSSISITRMPFYARAIATYFTRLLKPQEPEIIHGVDFLLKKVESNPEIYRFTARQIFNILRTAPYAEVEKVALYLGENYIVNRPEMWDPIFIQQFEEYATMASLNMAGTQANDLRLQDVAGNTLSLYDVQAKYTILLFFNPQCGACAVATPEIHTLYETYKDKGLQVVAVYLDRDKDTWLNYITEKNFLDWINLWDAEETSGMFEKYDLHAIPTIYLLDQNKQVIEKNLYYTALNSIIKQLFGEE